MFARLYMIALMLLINIVIARSMVPEQFGTYVLATNCMVFLCMVATAGLEQGAVKIIAGDATTASTPELKSLLKRIWMLFLMFALPTGTISCLLLRGRVGTMLGITEALVAPVLTCTILMAVLKVLAVFLRSLHSIGWSSLFDGRTGGAINNSMFLLLIMIFAAGRSQNVPLFWMFAISLALCIPWAALRLTKALKAHAEQHTGDRGTQETSITGSHILFTCLPLLASQLVAFLIAEGDVWMAGTYLEKDQTAIYGLARRLILQTMAPLQILNIMLSSSIAELYSKRKLVELEKMLRSTAAIGTLITVLTQGILVLFSHQILGFVFGDFYIQAGSILSILAVGELINAATGSCGLTLALGGRGKLLLIVNVVTMLLQFLFGVIAVRNYGPSGLAASFAATRGLSFIVMWAMARYYVGVWTHPTLTPIRTFRSMK